MSDRTVDETDPSLGLAQRAWWRALPQDEQDTFLLAGMARPIPLTRPAALLVIDATVDFTGTRPLPIQDAIRECSSSCGEYAWEALPRIQELQDAFRTAESPVIFTGRDLSAQRASVGATKRRATTLPTAVEFVEGLRPLGDEWLCVKARASSFYGTPLEAHLRKRGIRTLVLVGGSTSGCVRASAVDAFSAGFDVFVADDACFDRSPTQHLASLLDLNAKYATVQSADEIIRAFQSRAMEPG